MADVEDVPLTGEEQMMAQLLFDAFYELSAGKPNMSVVKAAMSFAGHVISSHPSARTDLDTLMKAVDGEIREAVAESLTADCVGSA